MGKTEKKNQKKRVPAAPLAVGTSTQPQQVKKSSLFEKRPRNYRIGGNIQPKRNLTRFTKWPQYIRLQRQKRIMLQRLKVPPSIAQFQSTVDKNQMAAICRLAKKIAPETAAQKKQRVKEMAGKKVDTDNKGLPVIKFGINHVTDLVEQKKAKLVLIAHDVDPIELVVWLPALCRKKNVAFCVVKSKARLGQLVGKKTASCCAIVNTHKEDQKELETLVESCTNAFNNNRELSRHWGGGLFGMKSKHVIAKRAALIEKETQKKTGPA